MNIRNATEADFPILAAIYMEAYNSLNIGEHWTPETAEKRVKHFYKEQADLFFVVEENGEILGATVAVVQPWWDGTRIMDGEIFVKVGAQGKGIGTKLIKKLFTTAKEKYNAIAWDTFTHRVYEHPLKWYKSMGFEEVKHWVVISGDIEKVLAKLG